MNHPLKGTIFQFSINFSIRLFSFTNVSDNGACSSTRIISGMPLYTRRSRALRYYDIGLFLTILRYWPFFWPKIDDITILAKKNWLKNWRYYDIGQKKWRYYDIGQKNWRYYDIGRKTDDITILAPVPLPWGVSYTKHTLHFRKSAISYIVACSTMRGKRVSNILTYHADNNDRPPLLSGVAIFSHRYLMDQRPLSRVS